MPGWMIVAALSAAVPGADAKANADCRQNVERTLPELRAADAFLLRGSVRQANAKLDLALQRLGTGYRQRGLMDDTGLKLALARSEERKGKLAASARIKRRMLGVRLHLCGYKAAK